MLISFVCAKKAEHILLEHSELRKYYKNRKQKKSETRISIYPSIRLESNYSIFLWWSRASTLNRFNRFRVISQFWPIRAMAMFVCLFVFVHSRYWCVLILNTIRKTSFARSSLRMSLKMTLNSLPFFSLWLLRKPSFLSRRPTAVFHTTLFFFVIPDEIVPHLINP